MNTLEPTGLRFVENGAVGMSFQSPTPDVLVLRDANGVAWRIVVSTDGQLVTTRDQAELDGAQQN